MQALVIGATGIVGGHILAQLQRHGIPSLALSRRAQTSDRAAWYQGDLARIADAGLPPVETLFCTAEIGLLAAALPQLDTSRLRRVVAFTSTSIVTKIESEIGSERELLRRLARGEQQLIAVCEQRGIGWTILRPTLIYDEGRDGNVSRIAGFIRRFGFFPLMGSGIGRRQPVHAEDLATGAIRAADSERARNQTYALPGGETLAYREMVGRIFDALGRPRRLIAVSPWLWEMAFAAAKPFFTSANVAMGRRMAMDMVFDGSAAQADFGWDPRPFRPNFSQIVRAK